MHPHDLNNDEIKAKLAIAGNLIREGKIFSAKTRDLEIALLGLCDQHARETHTIKEVNKGILFTSILMERRSRFSNGLVIGLAIIAILVGMIQIWVALPPKSLDNAGHEKRPNQQLDSDSQDQQTIKPVDTPTPIVPKDLADPAPNE